MKRALLFFIPREKELVDLVTLYNQIVNRHLDAIFEQQILSKNRLHQIMYPRLRVEYPSFPSALLQCARDQAIEIAKYGSYLSRSFRKPTSSIRFDLRTSKVFLNSGIVQLTTLKGRKSYKVSVYSHVLKYGGCRVTGVMAGIQKRKLKITVIIESRQMCKTDLSKTLGIDLGIKNFAVSSDGTFIKPNKIRRVKRKCAYLRRQLQSKGTPSATRHLQKLAGRERRFMRDFNHCLSKKIVETGYTVFALENLKYIRKGRKGRKFNRIRHQWPYFEFRQFLQYKAENVGKSVVLVNPRYTSQTCSCCGFISKENRNKGTFHCKQCNYKDSADLNASKNISSLCLVNQGRQVAVNQPIVADIEV